MKFELSRHAAVNAGERSDGWIWAATVQGEVIALGPETYHDEKTARSSIAKARKGFAGAKFAKVEVLGA